MSARRPATAIAVSFLLATICVSLGSLRAQSKLENPSGSPKSPPLAGSNSVSNLHIDQTKAGVWTAEFDYFYTGEPFSALLTVELTPQPGTPPGLNGLEGYQTVLPSPQRGAHHASVGLRYPGGQQRTLKAAVIFRSQMFSPIVLASQQLDKVIDWPDFQTWFRDQQVAFASPEENFNRAV